MTPEELQEIIDEVLQAVRTNSKTIAQLTEAASAVDGDYIELSGGRKVSIATLKTIFSGGGGGDDYVPTSRTINGNALTTDVTLWSGDIPDLRYGTIEEALVELASKASINSQGVLTTGEEQRLVIKFINTGSEIVTPTVAGVYYNGQTKQVETYKEQGTATISMIVKVFSEAPSTNVIYCDSLTNTMHRWDGTAMVQLSSGGGVEIVQTTGQATDKVMSQKAVSDLIGDVESLLSAI